MIAALDVSSSEAVLRVDERAVAPSIASWHSLSMRLYLVPMNFRAITQITTVLFEKAQWIMTLLQEPYSTPPLSAADVP